MDHDITINVNLPSSGISATGENNSEAMDGAGPAPMSFAELQLGGSSTGNSAPAPLPPGQLQAVSAASDGTGGPPPPAALDVLTSAMTPDAPTPIAFGSLQSDLSAPSPSSELLGAAAAGSDTPAPMALEDLESLADAAKAGAKKK